LINKINNNNMNKRTIKIVITNEIEFIPSIYINRKAKSTNIHFLCFRLITKGI